MVMRTALVALSLVSGALCANADVPQVAFTQQPGKVVVTIAGQHVGVTLMAHPGNFRPSWLHARDYGLLVANPFGRKAFRQGDPSKVVVKPGEHLRLRYGVLLHAAPAEKKPDLAAAYADFLRVVAE